MNITNENNKPIIKNQNKNDISKDNEIERLKRELKEEKEKNKNLENIINNLRTKNDNETENLKKEIKSYKEKIEKMKNDFQKLSSENNNLKDKMKGQYTKNNSDEIISLYKRIDDLNAKLKRYPFILEEGEKIMSIIFTSVDQNLNYSMICKNTDTINQLELELYKEYPKLGDAEYYFICNGAKVKKIKTLEELKIKSGDIIVLNVDENED